MTPQRVAGPVVAAALLGAVLAFATLQSRTTARALPEVTAPRIEGSTSALGPTPDAPAAVSPPPLVTPSASAPTTAPSASAPTGASSPTSAVSAGESARTVTLTTITTAEELYQAEVECDRKKLPESCERVGRALETGSAGTRDATRAAKLRRVALTLYVKQCETDRALACTRLAEMHEQGDMIQKNPKNAAALRKRVSELCRLRPNQLGCQDER